MKCTADSLIYKSPFFILSIYGEWHKSWACLSKLSNASYVQHCLDVHVADSSIMYNKECAVLSHKRASFGGSQELIPDSHWCGFTEYWT